MGAEDETGTGATGAATPNGRSAFTAPDGRTGAAVQAEKIAAENSNRSAQVSLPR